MAKKSVLGRGLSNLISGGSDDLSSTQTQDNPDYREIALGEIYPDPDQPRKKFRQEELEELAKTLQSVGLIEPVVVRKAAEGYRLISGERRWRAAKIAGLKNLPAVIKEVDDTTALEMSIIENIQREDLNPVEEARAYEKWISRTGEKPSVIAEKVGKDRATISNLLRILKLPAEVLELIEAKALSVGQARPLLGLGERKMIQTLALKIAKESWSSRRVEEEVAKLTDGTTSPQKGAFQKSKTDPNIAVVEERIRKKYTAKVKIFHSKNGSGKLTLHYATIEELDRILELMGIRTE